LPAGARLPAFRTLRSAWLFGPLFLRTLHTLELFHPFLCKRKAKTHLREHSRQSPVLKTASRVLRARFLRVVKILPRFFFLLSLVHFFPFSFSKEKEKETNEKEKQFKTSQNIRLYKIIYLKPNSPINQNLK